METQDDLLTKGRWGSKGSVTISSTISHRFWELAKHHSIKWSEALRVGIAMLLAERGVQEYDNNLNIYRKMNFFRQKAEEALKKVEELKVELSTKETKLAEKEAEEVLK